LFSTDPADFDRVLTINLAAPFHMTRLLVDALTAPAGDPGGTVINLASTRAFMSEPDSEGYAASKGGIVALTHAMAVSLASRQIRVNAIAPGWIDTSAWQAGTPEPTQWDEAEHRQHPAGRIGQPTDIAAACLYLAGPDAGFITGQTLVIDGGMTRKMIYR
jgi:NAD(P)-dependent dehydrogenase (short-subunit alcohol dehydrogenase family)